MSVHVHVYVRMCICVYVVCLCMCVNVCTYACGGKEFLGDKRKVVLHYKVTPH